MQRAISLGTHFCISAAKRFVFFMRNIYVIVTLYVAAMLLLLQLQIRIYFDSHSLRINFHISLPFFFFFFVFLCKAICLSFHASGRLVINPVQKQSVRVLHNDFIFFKSSLVGCLRIVPNMTHVIGCSSVVVFIITFLCNFPSFS